MRSIRTAALLASALSIAALAAAAEEPTAAPAPAPPAEPSTAQDAVIVDPGATMTDAQKAEAKQHFLDGGKHYADGQFQDAADHFVKAYDLTHAPELLYNLARCYERLGEKERAAEQYEMYLRMTPDAEDRVEVEQKIADLVGPPAPEEPKPEGAAEPAAAPGGKEIRLAVESGFDIPIAGEWDRKLVPLDVVLLFGLNDWLHLGFGLVFVGFVGDEPAGENEYPTGEFALQGEAAALKTIKGRFAFSARLAVAPTWIFRYQRDSVFWLAGRLGVGLHIDLGKSFGVLVEAVAAIGPVFNRDAEQWDHWPKVSLSADAGGRFGITYVF